jgi:hypothetical protein
VKGIAQVGERFGEFIAIPETNKCLGCSFNSHPESQYPETCTRDLILGHVLCATTEIIFIPATPENIVIAATAKLIGQTS